MYLSKLTIKKFRAIDCLTLNLKEGVNVFIGENNSGKSAIIDAIRICLGYGKQLREIGIKETDFYIDRNNPSYEVSKSEIEFHLHFSFDKRPEIAEKEKRYFLELIHQEEEKAEQEIQLHFKYWLVKSIQKDDKNDVRWDVWGGTYEGQSIPNEPLQLIGYTFLDALRDATQKLKPYSQNNKLVSLFENLIEFQKKGTPVSLDKDKKKELATNLVEWLKDDNDIYGNEWKYLIKDAKEKVKEHFKQSAIDYEPTDIEIGFSGYTYKDIINNLQMSIPFFKADVLTNWSEQKYLSLIQNGLGENNLIYAATVLGDLINRKEAGHYHALLIEEPEAHLHPQKQNTFFKYLNTLSDKNIQTFITSHSPTITAKTDLESVTVLQKKKSVTAVAVRQISLSDDNKRHLKKFLDVTKSQLFFAKGVILVEGISEAVLLPAFAKLMDEIDKENFLKAGNKETDWKLKFNLEKRGVEIVIVNGVAFEHFAKLFFAKERTQVHLLSRCAVLSDDDKNEHGKISDRASKILKLNDDKYVHVKLADKTFEYELFKASSENQKIMRTIYKKLHPGTNLISDGTPDELFNDLYKGRLEKDKANFALELADCLERLMPKLKNKFIIPEYIQDAIKWAVNEPETIIIGTTKQD